MPISLLTFLITHGRLLSEEEPANKKVGLKSIFRGVFLVPLRDLGTVEVEVAHLRTRKKCLKMSQGDPIIYLIVEFLNDCSLLRSIV